MEPQRPQNPYHRGGVGCHPGPMAARQPSTSGGKGNADPWLAGTAPPWTSALAMSQDSTRLSKLSFGCEALDGAFEGGIPVQGITEIAGEAGAGKTQLCLQLLLQAQLPPSSGGLGGKSYVLTCGEGDFPSRRLRQMAARYRDRIGVDTAKLMDGVCIQNARNLEEQMKIIMEHLPPLMGAHGIKLVVVDSIAALFRSDMGRGRSDMGQRSRLLGQLSQQMKRLGDRHRAAFVVVNQVTARFETPTRGAQAAGERGNDRAVVPAMGLLWSQCINTRFMVRRRDFSVPLRASTTAAGAGATATSGGDRNNLSPGKQRLVNNAAKPLASQSCGSSNAGQTRTAIAREITLEMSPSVPVSTSCGFVINVNGVTGVGWDGRTSAMGENP